MLKHLFTAIILLAAMAVYAQPTISGTIVDAKTGEPLIGAKVTHIPSGQEVFTGFDGDFEITGVTAGQTQIKVTYISYQETELNRVMVNEDGAQLNIKLHRSGARFYNRPVLAMEKSDNPNS